MNSDLGFGVEPTDPNAEGLDLPPWNWVEVFTIQGSLASWPSPNIWCLGESAAKAEQLSLSPPAFYVKFHIEELKFISELPIRLHEMFLKAC